MPEAYGVDELLCAVISRQVDDGDVLLEGIGTFLPAAAYELARRCHAPNAITFTPVGTVFRARPLGTALAGYESAALEAGLRQVSYGEMALQYLPAYLGRQRPAWKEFARPAQVDRWGNTNNVVIGDYATPTFRLPGAVGIPDGTSLLRSISLYVPRHTVRVLVPEVDFVSGLGWRRADGELREKHGRPRLLVTDLAVITFDSERGATLCSVHPGVTVDDVRAATGFDLVIGQVGCTEPPTPEELDLLRREIDPLGLRRLELYAARPRRALLRAALRGDAVPKPKPVTP